MKSIKSKQQKAKYISVEECIDILKNKPDKKEVSLESPKTSELIYLLYPAIQQMREKGYTLGEICDILCNECAIDININTFKNYVYRAGKRAASGTT